MGEELVVAGTEIVQERLPVAVSQETVLGALTVAGKEKTTLLALAG